MTIDNKHIATKANPSELLLLLTNSVTIKATDENQNFDVLEHLNHKSNPSVSFTEDYESRFPLIENLELEKPMTIISYELLKDSLDITESDDDPGIRDELNNIFEDEDSHIHMKFYYIYKLIFEVEFRDMLLRDRKANIFYMFNDRFFPEPIFVIIVRFWGNKCTIDFYPENWNGLKWEKGDRVFSLK